MAINQYKDGKGVNDHKKGNRTDSKRNTDTIQALNLRYKEDISAYKDFARKRRENRTARQEDCLEYYNRLISYIKESEETGQPITRAGMILRLGIGKDVYYRMKVGNLDYILYEYMDINNITEADIYTNKDGLPVAMVDNKEILLIPFSEMLEKSDLVLESQAESRLYSSSKVGDIFALKSLHGWRDDNGVQQHIGTVNQLVIATEEQARKAIELLK